MHMYTLEYSCAMRRLSCLKSCVWSFVGAVWNNCVVSLCICIVLLWIARDWYSSIECKPTCILNATYTLLMSTWNVTDKIGLIARDWYSSIECRPTLNSTCIPTCILNATFTLLMSTWNVTDKIGRGIRDHLMASGLFIVFVLPYFVRLWSNFHLIANSVRQKFENPDVHALIREGPHFERDEEEGEVTKAFLNQTDTLGLVGVVFGPAGTGKSNVVRTVCKGKKGVIYMEIGSPRQFPYHLAIACGVPVEPNWLNIAISKLFPAWKTHLTLPSKDEEALALVLPVIAEGCNAYKEKNNKRIPVLFIDGVDILAKQTDNTLYVNLVDWAKKCANEDSLRIVLVCSDSHVLALDQQSFKSRLDALIEIGDVTEDQAVQTLMMDKYGFENYLAKNIYDIVGGRLADIHKVVAVWRSSKEVVVPQEVVNAVKRISNTAELRTAIHAALDPGHSQGDKSEDIDADMKELVRGIIRSKNFTPMEKDAFIKKTKCQFNREMQQALCKVLCKRNKHGKGNAQHEMDEKPEIKLHIIKEALNANNPKTVEEIAFGYPDHSQIESVVASIHEFLVHNVLRITKHRTLLCYNKSAHDVLTAYVTGRPKPNYCFHCRPRRY